MYSDGIRIDVCFCCLMQNIYITIQDDSLMSHLTFTKCRIFFLCRVRDIILNDIKVLKVNGYDTPSLILAVQLKLGNLCSFDVCYTIS